MCCRLTLVFPCFVYFRMRKTTISERRNWRLTLCVLASHSKKKSFTWGLSQAPKTHGSRYQENCDETRKIQHPATHSGFILSLGCGGLQYSQDQTGDGDPDAGAATGRDARYIPAQPGNYIHIYIYIYIYI